MSILMEDPSRSYYATMGRDQLLRTIADKDAEIERMKVCSEREAQMSNRGKTLVKGHTLLFEGSPCGDAFWKRSGTGRGKCSCGIMSPLLPSNAARQRWHRQHKQEMRENNG